MMAGSPEGLKPKETPEAPETTEKVASAIGEAVEKVAGVIVSSPVAAAAGEKAAEAAEKAVETVMEVPERVTEAVVKAEKKIVEVVEKGLEEAKRRTPPGEPKDHLQRALLLTGGGYALAVVGAACVGFKNENAYQITRMLASMPFPYLNITLTFTLRKEEKLLRRIASFVAAGATAASTALQIFTLKGLETHPALPVVLLSLSNAAEAWVCRPPVESPEEESLKNRRIKKVQQGLDIAGFLTALGFTGFFTTAAIKDKHEADSPVPWQQITVFPAAVTLLSIHHFFELWRKPSLPRWKQGIVSLGLLLALFQLGIAAAQANKEKIFDLLLIISQNLAIACTSVVMMLKILDYIFHPPEEAMALIEAAELTEAQREAAKDALKIAEQTREGLRADTPPAGHEPMSTVEEGAITPGAMVDYVERETGQRVPAEAIPEIEPVQPSLGVRVFQTIVRYLGCSIRNQKIKRRDSELAEPLLPNHANKATAPGRSPPDAGTSLPSRIFSSAATAPAYSLPGAGTGLSSGSTAGLRLRSPPGGTTVSFTSP